jgi:hypothetical protein
MEYLFPDADSKEYCAGSQDLSAPGFLALCTAYGKVMNRLNHVVQLFKDYLEDADDLITEMGWWDGLALIDRYRAAIPPLSGNDGDPIAENAASGNVSTAAAIAVTPAAPAAVVSVEPTIAQTPTLQRSEKKPSFADFIAPIGSVGTGNKAPQQEQGLVYKEEPPVAVNQWGQPVQPVVRTQPATVNAFMQAPVAPAGWPTNSGYVPGATVPVAPAYNQPQSYSVPPAAPQLIDATHLTGQFPVPPNFRLAMEMPSQQLVVINPQGQPLGYYQVVMPQIAAAMQQPPAYNQQPVYGQQPVFTAPNQFNSTQQPAFVGRSVATQQLQQRDYMNAITQQPNQWGGHYR